MFEASGQLQIIYGTGTVDKVYDEFIHVAGISGATKEEAKALLQPIQIYSEIYKDSWRYFCSDNTCNRCFRIFDGNHECIGLHGG